MIEWVLILMAPISDSDRFYGAGGRQPNDPPYYYSRILSRHANQEECEAAMEHWNSITGFFVCAPLKAPES